VKRVIAMPMDAGGVIQIEVDSLDSERPAMRGGLPSLEKSVQSFEAAVASIKPAALTIVQQFADIAAGTSSVRLTFGLKFSAEAGAIIAAVGSEANFEVEVTWERGTTA
jgi:hypothetical protein